MHIFKRTVLSGALAVSVLLSAMPAFAGATVYDLTDTKILAGGVQQTTVRRLMTDGWQTINIVQADLSDDGLDIKLLTNGESIHKLSTVKSLADEHNTIAAVNGDFFQWKSGQSGHGSSLGIEMVDGNLLSSPADNWQMSTVARREDGSFIFDYLDCGITITAADGTAVDIKHINKFDDLSVPVIYNHFWGTTSVGSGGGIVEMVVENDTVQSFHYEDGPIAIPENGYVVTFLSDYTPQIIEHFHEGESISLSTWYVPDFENIKFAVGAGSLLLVDGQKTNITHNIAGAQPRTAIGTSADGKTAYLVTVDGRQALAKGVTLSELADILLEFGIANAANLDGGGSTTLVTKSFETGEQTVSNLPSDGSLRAVANGIGFVSAAEPGVLDSFHIATDSENVFVNTGLLLHITGRDQAMNIVEYDTESLHYNVSDDNGVVKDGLFYPSATGKQIVTAVLGDKYGTKEVNVLPSPSRLSLDTQQVDLSSGDSYYVNLTGYTADGYHAPINLMDTNINVSNPGIVDFVGNNLIAVGRGSTAVTFEFGGVTASMVVNVDRAVSLTDDFEDSNGEYWAYPDYVAGTYAISSEQAHSGSSSGKLTFDFTGSQQEAKSANINFANGGKQLSGSVANASVWVYGSSSIQHPLKAMFTDANGTVYRMDIASSVNWDGWKKLDIPLPETEAKPLTLTKLYLVQTDYSIQNTGTLYFDDLTFDGGSGEAFVPAGLPQDVRKDDPANTVTQPSENAFKFVVFGRTNQNNTLAEKLLVEKFKTVLQTTGEIAFFVGNGAEIPDGIGIQTVKTSGFTVFDYKGSTFITLDNSAGSVMETDRSQWARLVEIADTIENKNVFLFMPQADAFQNDYEKDLFYDILQTKFLNDGQRVYIFSDGSIDAKAIDGIRYFTTNGVVGFGEVGNAVREAGYFEVTVDGDTVTYQSKKLYE